jgi:hypothetical protein
MSPPSSGSKRKPSKKPEEADDKLISAYFHVHTELKLSVMRVGALKNVLALLCTLNRFVVCQYPETNAVKQP